MVEIGKTDLTTWFLHLFFMPFHSYLKNGNFAVTPLLDGAPHLGAADSNLPPSNQVSFYLSINQATLPNYGRKLIAVGPI